MKKWLSIVLIVVCVLLAGLVAFLLLRDSPLAVVSHYPMDTLMEEAATMQECAECHETEKFHTCSTCHDDHGALEMENVPFYAVISFTGDVPKPGYVLVDDVLPYRDQPHTMIPLRDFLAKQGVMDFESVTLASDDQGYVTIANDQLADDALLMPYEDGIRFAAESLHISTWIKGIKKIIIIGAEKPLTIDGEATSIGRLLTGPTVLVTVEQTPVMLISEVDGETRKALTAKRIEGVALTTLSDGAFSSVAVTDDSGEITTLDAETANTALIALVNGIPTVVLPERGRSQWTSDIVAVEFVD